MLVYIKSGKYYKNRKEAKESLGSGIYNRELKNGMIVWGSTEEELCGKLIEWTRAKAIESAKELIEDIKNYAITGIYCPATPFDIKYKRWLDEKLGRRA